MRHVGCGRNATLRPRAPPTKGRGDSHVRRAEPAEDRLPSPPQQPPAPDQPASALSDLSARPTRPAVAATPLEPPPVWDLGLSPDSDESRRLSSLDASPSVAASAQAASTHSWAPWRSGETPDLISDRPFNQEMVSRLIRSLRPSFKLVPDELTAGAVSVAHSVADPLDESELFSIAVPKSGPLVLGARLASGCDVVVDMDVVSAKHAIFQMLRYKGSDILLVQDAGSTNGVYRNGARLRPWTYVDLVMGDTVTLGSRSSGATFTVQPLTRAELDTVSYIDECLRSLCKNATFSYYPHIKVLRQRVAFGLLTWPSTPKTHLAALRGAPKHVQDIYSMSYEALIRTAIPLECKHKGLRRRKHALWLLRAGEVDEAEGLLQQWCRNFPTSWGMWKMAAELDLYFTKRYTNARVSFRAAMEAADIGLRQLKMLQGAALTYGLEMPGYAYARALSGRIALLTSWGQSEWLARNKEAARRLWGAAEAQLPNRGAPLAEIVDRAEEYPASYEQYGGISLMWTWAACELEGGLTLEEDCARATSVLRRALAACPDDERLLLLLFKVHVRLGVPPEKSSAWAALQRADPIPVMAVCTYAESKAASTDDKLAALARSLAASTDAATTFVLQAAIAKVHAAALNLDAALAAQDAALGAKLEVELAEAAQIRWMRAEWERNERKRSQAGVANDATDTPASPPDDAAADDTSDSADNGRAEPQDEGDSSSAALAATERSSDHIASNGAAHAAEEAHEGPSAQNGVGADAAAGDADSSGDLENILFRGIGSQDFTDAAAERFDFSALDRDEDESDGDDFSAFGVAEARQQRAAQKAAVASANAIILTQTQSPVEAAKLARTFYSRVIAEVYVATAASCFSVSMDNPSANKHMVIRALRAAQAALQTGQGQLAAHVLAARANFTLQNAADAWKHLRSALRLNSSDSAALMLLAQMLLADGRKGEAYTVRSYAKALQMRTRREVAESSLRDAFEAVLSDVMASGRRSAKGAKAAQTRQAQGVVTDVSVSQIRSRKSSGQI